MHCLRAFSLAIPFLLASLPAGAGPKTIGKLTVDGAPEIPADLTGRLAQYQNTRSAALQGWSGGGMLITTRFAETAQVHWVRKPGGARRQLTFLPEPVYSASPPPGDVGGSFLYLKDNGGDEFHQIFRFDPEGGSSELLTDGTSRNGGVLWSDEGDRFAYASTRRNGKDYEILIAEADDPANARLAHQGEGSWGVLDWAPGGGRLLLRRYVSANESHLHILDLASGALEPVHLHPEKIGVAAYGPAKWGADGRTIYMTSDEGSEFTRLLAYDPAAKTARVLTADIDWDVAELAADPARTRLAFTVNEGGLDKLYLLDWPGGERREVPGLPRGQISGLAFHPDGRRLGFTANGSTTPGDSFSLDLASLEIERWTESETGGLNPESFVEPELIHYPSFDEADGKPRTIPAFLYKPRNGTGKFPVVVYIHGGPESQFVPAFNPAFQFYLNEMGIAIVAPNVRGSAGYGKSYLLLDNGFKREDSVKDIGALLDWIAARPDLDAARVAVMGGSYGGYMTYASMVHFGARLRCGLASVGIGNFVTFLKNTQPYRRDLRRVEYGDERDPKTYEFLLSISPALNASKIDKPMLIAHGENDPRVPAAESRVIAAAIRANGVPAWTIHAADEGHGFAKKGNRDYLQAAQVLFLEEFLLK